MDERAQRTQRQSDDGERTAEFRQMYSNPIKHYGDLDLALNKFQANQTGPIKRFMS